MIIKQGQKGYEEIAKARFENEEQLVDSILKQCIAENQVETIESSTKKDGLVKDRIIHYKLPSGLHVYKHQKGSVIRNMIVPKEGDSREIRYYIDNGMDPRSAITATPAALVYEYNTEDKINKSIAYLNCEVHIDDDWGASIKAEIQMKNGKAIQKTQYIKYGSGPRAFSATDIENTHKRMLDEVYTIIDLSSDESTFGYIEKFQQLEKMLDIERVNMALNNGDNRSSKTPEKEGR